jgi:hypothetical protein
VDGRVDAEDPVDGRVDGDVDGRADAEDPVDGRVDGDVDGRADAEDPVDGRVDALFLLYLPLALLWFTVFELFLELL